MNSCNIVNFIVTLITLPNTVVIFTKGYQLGQFPFGQDAGDSQLHRNDDHSSSVFNVSFQFFGIRETSLYVSVEWIINLIILYHYIVKNKCVFYDC